jgi:hypothetical protein
MGVTAVIHSSRVRLQHSAFPQIPVFIAPVSPDRVDG